MKLFRTIALIVCLILGYNMLPKAQTTLNPYALVRIYETTDKNHSQILVTYESGITEKINLPYLEFSGSKNNFDEVSGTIVKTLNQMVTKGYKIIATSHSAYGLVTITTYTMEKVE